MTRCPPSCCSGWRAGPPERPRGNSGREAVRRRGYRDTDGSALLSGLGETVRPLCARFPGWYTGAMTTTRTTALAGLVWLPAIHFSEELPAATLSQGEDVGEGLRTPARGHHPPSHAGRGAPGNAPSACSISLSVRGGPGAGGAGVLALPWHPSVLVRGQAHGGPSKSSRRRPHASWAVNWPVALRVAHRSPVS